MDSTPGSTGSVSVNVECLFMVPTFPVGDQVESARMMAFFSTDLERPIAGVVHATVNRTTLHSQLCHSQPHNCSDWSNHIWCSAALTKTDIYSDARTMARTDIYSDARTMARTFTVISVK